MKNPPLAALLLVLSPPMTAAAQTVAGELVDPSGGPVRAALVVLFDSAGVRRASTLTDAAGRFRLHATAEGSYRVRAERVGYAAASSDPLLLRGGQTTPLRLVASTEAVRLEGITARAGSRCSTVEESAGSTAVLWEEARKALAAAERATESSALHYEFVHYRRELDVGSLAVRSEVRDTRSATVATPFRSTPLDTLLIRGFVRATGDSVVWDAPDGQVLLSPRFLATHCFQAVEHPDSSTLVGLGFRPVPGRRMPEVTGTLWLDRSTAMLRYLEYRYLNVGAPGRHGRVGGRVEFEQLPSGHWMVRRWYIRLPQAAPEEIFPSPVRTPVASFRTPGFVRGLLEVGGEVTGASDQPLAGAPGTGAIAGVVWDSVRGRPLQGARVVVSGTARGARTDSTGAFRIDSIQAGVYSVSFTHPLQAATRVPPTAVDVVVPDDSAREVRLAVAGPTRVHAAECGAEGRGGLLIGHVHSGGSPVRAARVSVSWSGTERQRTSAVQQRVQMRTDETGLFLVCGIPADRPLQLSVSWEGRSHGTTFSFRGNRTHYRSVDL